MSALAVLGAGREETVALVARPPHPLARLLVHQLLAARLAGLGHVNLLRRVYGVVRDDGHVLLVPLENGGPPLAAGGELGLGPGGRLAQAAVAADVVAVGALAGVEGEAGAAAVAGTADAHADGLVNTQHGLVGLDRLPVAGHDLEAVAFTKLLRPLLKHLRLGKRGNARDSLIPGASLLVPGHGRRDAGDCLSAEPLRLSSLCELCSLRICQLTS